MVTTRALRLIASVMSRARRLGKSRQTRWIPERDEEMVTPALSARRLRKLNRYR
ncbi:hypothetical protein GCM10010166_25270 [Couchioplanes caeruleus subsp. azureus]|nr:hypothetical protein GCM10010166_25270 [Couchioplanes caeruleus subsp. azureus]